MAEKPSPPPSSLLLNPRSIGSTGGVHKLPGVRKPGDFIRSTRLGRTPDIMHLTGFSAEAAGTEAPAISAGFSVLAVSFMGHKIKTAKARWLIKQVQIDLGMKNLGYSLFFQSPFQGLRALRISQFLLYFLLPYLRNGYFGDTSVMKPVITPEIKRTGK
jgi:hypothetical protein